jgi:hypothetical protein
MDRGPGAANDAGQSAAALTGVLRAQNERIPESMNPA